MGRNLVRTALETIPTDDRLGNGLFSLGGVSHFRIQTKLQTTKYDFHAQIERGGFLDASGEHESPIAGTHVLDKDTCFRVMDLGMTPTDRIVRELDVGVLMAAHGHHSGEDEIRGAGLQVS